MKNNISEMQKKIKVGTHGEDYGSWMSNPVFYAFGAGILLAAALTVLSFAVFKITVLGIIFAVAVAVLLAMTGWMAWIRRQYAFGKGGMMEQVHRTILSNLDFDGQGKLLEVGCGSGAMSVRAALTWPNAQITGLDYWAVISNYVYHNIMGANKQDLLLESLRVLKKGGVFLLHDNMKPAMYGDMNAFAEKLRGMGFSDVRYVETAEPIFGSKKRAAAMMLGDSAMIVGKK